MKRICSRCKKLLEDICFYKNKKSKYNRSWCKKCSKDYWEKNKENLITKQRIYYIKNKEAFRKKHSLYYKEHKKERTDYFIKKYNTDPSYRIANTLRGRIYKALKKNKKQDKTIILLGCSIDQLKHHLEKQFKEGMTWNNYGKSGWWIDHIIPCASFNLALNEEQMKCFHYTNLQPLWAIDNIKKGKKI